MDRMLVLIQLFPVVYFTTVASIQENVCHRPEMAANIETDAFQRFFGPGAELTLSCIHGYTPHAGPSEDCLLCQWTMDENQIIVHTWVYIILVRTWAKRCPYPEPLANGELHYEDVVFQSTIDYTCDEGYTLTGESTSVCLANGRWSAEEPECKPLTCDLAPIPQFGMIIYDKRITGDTIDYGLGGTYTCLPPYVVIGNPRAECTINGNWTQTPECRVVTCPPPEDIDNGFMSSYIQKSYDYKETVSYGCNGDYALEGSLQIVCQQNGKWSEKPSCKAPCSVGIQRARILYKGNKIWIKDLQPNLILHKDIVSVYCMEKVRKCGYAVPTQCNGGILKIPECFEQPSAIDYNVYSDSLPSEIKQC